MKVLQIILGTLALCVASTQAFRHAYLLWVEPRGSVLDKFNKTEKNINDAQTLEELVALYEKAREEEEKAEREERARIEARKKEARDEQKEAGHPNERTYFGPRHDSQAAELKRAIETWEDHEKQMYKLHFYWWAGLCSAALGLGTYFLINRWLGMTGILAGVSEMLWWTSPTFRAGGANLEFDRLVMLKFVYATVTYLLVFAGWLVLQRQYRRQQRMQLDQGLPDTGQRAAP